MAKKRHILPKMPLPDDEKLIAFLNNQLSEEETKKMESTLEASNFTKEALEGLRAFGEPQNLTQNINQLNKTLRHNIKPKAHKRKASNAQLIWFIVAVLIILIIIIAGLEVIHLKL